MERVVEKGSLSTSFMAIGVCIPYEQTSIGSGLWKRKLTLRILYSEATMPGEWMCADAIRVCQKILPQGHFIQGELQETGLPDTHFDYIRIDNALEHVPNPREVVRECYRLLRHGGQLLVYVPHGRSLSIRLMKGNSISSWIPFHLQLFTRKSLRLLMEEAGFTDIRIYGYNPTSWLPLSLIQLWNKKQPTLKLGHPTWLSLVCYPIGWLAAKLGIGEELVGIGFRG